MLRITRKANGEVVLKLSGHLNAENVAEVRALIATESKGSRIVLACADFEVGGCRGRQASGELRSRLDQAEELRPLHPRVDQKRAVGKNQAQTILQRRQWLHI
jgi:hypothetical protein